MPRPGEAETIWNQKRSLPYYTAEYFRSLVKNLVFGCRVKSRGYSTSEPGGRSELSSGISMCAHAASAPETNKRACAAQTDAHTWPGHHHPSRPVWVWPALGLTEADGGRHSAPWRLAPRTAPHRRRRSQGRACAAAADDSARSRSGSIFLCRLSRLSHLISSRSSSRPGTQGAEGHGHPGRIHTRAQAQRTEEMPGPGAVQSSDPCRDPTVKAKPPSRPPALECGPSSASLSICSCNSRERDRGDE